jgi:TrmH family RNA methyltransferase
MITSTQNQAIKHLRKLQTASKYRHQSGSFVVEGVRLVEEAFHSGWKIRKVYYTDFLSSRGEQLITAFSNTGIEHWKVAEHVMESISDTRNPQGICALVELRSLQPPVSPNLVLVLDSITDPGNLGTILRTAAAAGVQAVFITPGTTDPLSPKVVRSGAGAQFRIPVIKFSWHNGQLLPSGLTCFAADASAKTDYLDADFRGRNALLIGSEAHGLSRDAQSIIDQRISIKMPGGTESLNAAVSTGIILFEMLRQRKDHRGAK